MVHLRHLELTTSVRSLNASPLSTELMRTARSRIPDGTVWSIAFRTRLRALAFICSVTLSSRSYVTQSAVNERDLSRKRWEEPGTGWWLAGASGWWGSWKFPRLKLAIEKRATKGVTCRHLIGFV